MIHRGFRRSSLPPSVCARSEALTAASCAGSVSAADLCEPSGKAALVIAVTAVAADTASAFETRLSVRGLDRAGGLTSPISKPATAAMTPPTRMTVPNNAAAVIATRRGFHRLRRSLESCYGQASDNLIFRIENDRTMTRTAAFNLS